MAVEGSKGIVRRPQVFWMYLQVFLRRLHTGQLGARDGHSDDTRGREIRRKEPTGLQVKVCVKMGVANL